MRLEKKRQEELAERKGLTGKTIIQIIWLVISFAISYIVLEAFEANDTISFVRIHRSLSLPPEVPTWAVQVGIMLIFVLVMQFILFMAFVWTSPEGRRRPGQPTLESRSKDPFDDSLRRH
jgi:hypothetical protein